MRLNGVARCTLAFAGMCLGASSVVADDLAKERADGLKLGEQLLKELKPLAEGKVQTDYFELVKEGETLGFAVMTLEAVKEEQRVVYRYVHDSGTTVSEDTLLLGSMKATLTPQFAPLVIDMEHTMVVAPGFVLTIEEDLNFREKSIEMSRKDRGARVSREVPIPEGPFVFSLVSLLQRADLAKYPKFSLRRLDPESGKTTNMNFTVETKPDGSRRVNSTTDDGKDALRVEVAADGTVSSWSQAPSPYIEKRSTKERVDELKTRIRTP